MARFSRKVRLIIKWRSRSVNVGFTRPGVSEAGAMVMSVGWLVITITHHCRVVHLEEQMV